MSSTRILWRSFGIKSISTKFSIKKSRSLSTQKSDIDYQAPILQASSRLVQCTHMSKNESFKDGLNLPLSMLANRSKFNIANQISLGVAYVTTLTNALSYTIINCDIKISLLTIASTWASYVFLGKKISDNSEKYFIKFKHRIISNNTFHFEKFDQNNFNKKISSSYPNLFKDDGHCFGHTIMWYKYQLENKNYITELEKLEFALNNKSSLSNAYFYLLSSITYIQHNQWHPAKINEINIKNNEGRREVVNDIINHANKHPYDLVSMIIRKDKSAHIIGVVSTKMEIKYFDSNNGEAIFTTPEAAKIGLSRLITYYSNKHYYSAYNLSHHIIWKTKPDAASNNSIKNDLHQNNRLII